MQKLVKVKVLRLFNDGRQEHKPGTIVDIPLDLLAHYKRHGKVIEYVVEAPKAAKPKAEPTKTTKKRKPTKKKSK